MEEENVKIATELDLERQKRAKLYARINRRLMVVDLAISGVYIAAWLVFGWSEALKEWLNRSISNEWLLILAYIAILGGIMLIVNIPLTFYQGFSLPHRFELSTQKLGGWITDQIKGLLVGGIIGLVVLEIIYAVLRAYPTLWWLWAAGILLISM